MAGERNHYERAFSALLKEQGVKALAVEERRRPAFEGRVLKHFDFLVNGSDKVLAVDLKGRRQTPWITRTDLFSMMGWQNILAGKASLGFLFAFMGEGRRLAELPALVWECAGARYHFCLLPLEDAQRLARPRSARWGTFGFEWKAFCRSVRGLEGLISAQIPR